MYRIAVEGCCRAVFLAYRAGAIHLFFCFFFLLLLSREQRGKLGQMQAAVTSRMSPADWHLYLKRDTCASTHSLSYCVILLQISWCVKEAESFPSVVVCEKALLEHLNFILTALYISWSPESCVEDCICGVCVVCSIIFVLCCVFSYLSILTNN